MRLRVSGHGKTFDFLRWYCRCLLIKIRCSIHLCRCSWAGASMVVVCKLQIVKSGIRSAPAISSVCVSAFLDLSVFEDKNFVRAPNRGRRCAITKVVRPTINWPAPSDKHSPIRIQLRGRFVENQNRRIFQDRAQRWRYAAVSSLKRVPRSPITRIVPPGNSMMKSCAALLGPQQ